MWRNLKFLHMWSKFKLCYMKDVEKSEISPHLASVWWGEGLHMCEIHVFLLLNLFCRNLCTFVANWFVAIYALLYRVFFFNCVCVEKKWQISVCDRRQLFAQGCWPQRSFSILSTIGQTLYLVVSGNFLHRWHRIVSAPPAFQYKVNCSLIQMD